MDNKILNFREEDKAAVEATGYSYYDFTEEKVREIAKKGAKEVTYKEWCCLLQMLYPRCMIASGLFEPFLVFEVRNGKRKDPPKEHWPDLVNEGSAGVLLEGFVNFLDTEGITTHPSWRKLCKRRNASW